MTTDNIIYIFNQYKEYAFIISIIISILISLAGIVPSIFVTAANIIFFGPFYGFMISLIGETVGGYITFKIYRRGLKSYKNKIEGRYIIIDNIMKSKGRKAGALIFEARIIPFIPSGFVTLACAISSVSDTAFIIATFIGKIPSIALEVIVSYDIINIKENYLRLGIIIFAIICGIIIKKLYYNES